MAEKNMALALILSFFIPGLGVIYDGEYGRGITYLIIFIIATVGYFYLSTPDFIEEWATTITMLFWLNIVVWAISLYDTFATTKSINY